MYIYTKCALWLDEMSVPPTTVAQSHICACNGRDYRTAGGLRAHQKTQKHLSWEWGAELRALKMDLIRRDNRILELERDAEILTDFNHRLVRELYALRMEAKQVATAL